MNKIKQFITVGFNKNIENIFLITILSGYIVICSFYYFFDTDARNFSVPFRSIVFIIALFIIYNSYKVNRLFDRTIFVFILFWILYFIKAVYSFQSHYFIPKISNQEYETYVRIVVNCFIPTLALLTLDLKKVNFKIVIKVIHSVFVIMLFLNSVIDAPRYQGVSPGIFALYYISSGHLGTTLAIISTYYLLFLNNSAKMKIWYIITFFLGIYTIYISGARSPFLALLVSLFYLVIVKKDKKYIISFFAATLFLVGLIYFIGKNNTLQSSFVTRTYTGLFEGNGSGRSYFVNKGVAIIGSHLIVGSQILFEDGMYPHNMFLDILLSVGIIGLLLFLGIYYEFFKNMKIFFRTSQNQIAPLIFALWLQFFILAQLSFNTISNVEFWYLSALIIAFSKEFIYEKT